MGALVRCRHVVAVVVALAMTGGCTGDGARPLPPSPPAVAGDGGGTPEAPPASVEPEAAVAAPGATATPTTGSPTPAAAPGPPGTCPPVPARAEPAAGRPSYEVSVTIDAAARTATGTSSVRFTPDLPVDRLVLRLWPNSPQARSAGGSMRLDHVEVDRRVVTPSQPDPTTVVLPGPVAAGTTVTVSTAWTITLASGLGERWTVAGQGVRLGSFVPLLPWEPGRGWATDPPTLVHGEATTSPVADWGLTVAAGGLDVVATGTPSGPGRWTATAVRDLAVSAGHFRRAEATTPAGPGGAPVSVVVVADAGVPDDPAAYLRKLVQVLPSLARRFGPYPYPSYTVALSASLRGGIENPMLTFQGPDSLGRSTSHEAAHMWFYALVGNDQGRDPWLDEGLATWAEAGYEGTLASFRSRAIPSGVAGHAGRPTSFFESQASSYYAGVYVQGTQALAALGPPDLVDCALRIYVERRAHTIATDADLLAALTPTFPDAAAVLARYGIRA